MYYSALILLLVSLAAVSTADHDEVEDIYAGSPAQRGQIPYIVRCMQIKNTGARTICGGSIISARWVLTAAHCTTNVVRVLVSMGMTDVNNHSGVLTYEVEEDGIYANPQYDPKTVNNDIALYHFDKPVPFCAFPYIRAIKLPTKSQADPSTFAGQIATASGYGLINDDGPIASRLQYTTMRVQSHAKCQSFYRALTGREGVITQGMICADRNTSSLTGTCQGDSGGPLAVTGSDGQPLLIGATSWSLGKCRTNIPDVLVNVAHYLDWINRVSGIAIS